MTNREPTMTNRKVTLRAERSGSDVRNLRAYLLDDGSLRIEGQDLGPGTAMVSDDGEYEWYRTVRAGDVPQLVRLLGGEPSSDVLDLLQERYTGTESYELERVLRESEIPVETYVV